MKLCIILSLIIIVLLFINIYKYDLFTDYTSSNNYVLSGGIIKNGLVFNSQMLQDIIIEESEGNVTNRQSQLFSCNPDKKDVYNSSSISSETQTQTPIQEWFKESDTDGNKIKCPDNNIFIDKTTICKNDDWYDKCNSSDNVNSRNFCKYLCNDEEHHLRNVSEYEKCISGGGFWSCAKGGEISCDYVCDVYDPVDCDDGSDEDNQFTDGSASVDFCKKWNEGKTEYKDQTNIDICKYVDKDNGRAWFSEKKNDGDKSKCPNSNIYIDTQKICSPESSYGSFMDENKEFKCNSEPPWNSESIGDIYNKEWYDDGSDEMCCPKTEKTYDISPALAQTYGKQYVSPLLVKQFCETNWKDRGEKSDNWTILPPNIT